MADRPHLLALTSITPILHRLLEERFTLHVDPATAQLDQIRGVVGGGQMRIDAAVLERLPALEIAAVHGVGHDAIDLATIAARRVRVTTTPGVLTDDVADLAIGLMLAVRRRIAANDAALRAGVWEAVPGARASGRTIGIVGLGAIGRAIACRAVPFAHQVSYTGHAPKRGARWSFVPKLATLAADSDVLILAAPATAKTIGMVDAAVLDALGPSGVLVNVARGSLVDEAALIAALQTGRIAGAGLDVFADEPKVPDALLRLDNVVLSAHQGSNTRETRAAMASLVVANLVAHFAGRPLPTAIA